MSVVCTGLCAIVIQSARADSGPGVRVRNQLREIVREMSKEPIQTDRLEIGQAIGQATDPGRLAIIIIIGTVGVGLLIGEGTVLAARGIPDIEIVVNTLLMVSGIGLIL